MYYIHQIENFADHLGGGSDGGRGGELHACIPTHVYKKHTSLILVGGGTDSHFKECLAWVDLVHLHEGVAKSDNDTTPWIEVLELKENGCT